MSGQHKETKEKEAKEKESKETKENNKDGEKTIKDDSEKLLKEHGVTDRGGDPSIGRLDRLRPWPTISALASFQPGSGEIVGSDSSAVGGAPPRTHFIESHKRPDLAQPI